MIETMFGNRWFIGLNQSHVSFVFFNAVLDGPSALSDLHLATFTRDPVNVARCTSDRADGPSSSRWGFQPQQILEATAAQAQGEEASADYTTVIPPALALIYLPLPQPVMHLPTHSQSLAFHWLLHQPARTLSSINTPHIPSLVILHSPAYEGGTDRGFRNVGY